MQATGKSGRAGIAGFTVVALALLAALAVTQRPLVAGDIFLADQDGRRAALDTQSLDDLAHYKLAHASANASTNGAVRVGLFGNSRSVMVSHDDLGLPDGTFFNFSLPGGSFRQSIMFLEALEHADALPRRVLVSLDHLSLGFYGTADYPGAATRWGRAAGDVMAMWRATGSPVPSLKAAADHLFFEWRKITELFSMARLRARLAFAGLLPAGAAPAAGGQPVRTDGSRIEPPATGGPLESPPAATMQFTTPVYLARDLDRLAALARRTGAEIIVYESPLAPNFSHRNPVAAQPERLRAIVAQRCTELALRCVLNPSLPGTPDASPAWPDCCHAPAGVLGEYLQAMLSRNGSGR